MNILYLHGLLGRLNDEKREVLENHGKVFAPDIDYQNDLNTIAHLVKTFAEQEEEINVVIGSSMGGLAGWYVSNSLKRPALLFNPALATRSVYQEIPDASDSSLSFKQIVLGGRDDIINPAETLKFISQKLSGASDIQINLRQHLAHRIPVDVFEDEVESFFGKMCY